MSNKTHEQKAAWLDGYMAATDTASSFKVRIGHEIDEPLNLGAQMVSSVLQSQVRAFQDELNAHNLEADK